MFTWTLFNVFSSTVLMPYLILFFGSFMVVAERISQLLSDSTITSSHAEWSLANVQLMKLGILLLSNGMEAIGLISAVQQRHYKKDQHLVIMSCLPDSLQFLETHSIEACFCISVQ